MWQILHKPLEQYGIKTADLVFEQGVKLWDLELEQYVKTRDLELVLLVKPCDNKLLHLQLWDFAQYSKHWDIKKMICNL